MQVKIRTIHSIIIEPLDEQGNPQGSTHGFATLEDARNYVEANYQGAEIIEQSN